MTKVTWLESTSDRTTVQFLYSPTLQVIPCYLSQLSYLHSHSHLHGLITHYQRLHFQSLNMTSCANAKHQLKRNYFVKLKVILGFFTPNFLYLKKVKHKARFHVISTTYMSLPGYGVSGSRLLKAVLTHGDS